ncbi:MAG: BREX system ATP-binding domain-containing protein, partial [Acidobacteriota bacterium]
MIGTKLGNRYEITGELGRGGMGVVYRARDPLLNREVAVKLVPPVMLTAQSEERFQREAQVVAQMDHPAIVPIYDIGQHEGSMYFLMPVVRGLNLRAFLHERTRSLGDIIDIGIQAADGLEYSHALGVVHRDIKPENIMVADDEGSLRIRIMDFGLARATTDQRLTRTGTLVGTVAYFSPEQVVTKDVDHRTDVYSLGTVLYEAICGEPPFTGEMQAILYRIVHENPRSPRELGADISPELEEIILRSLAKDPARRYRTAGEMAEALRTLRGKLQESDRARVIALSSVMTAQMARPSLSPFIGREKEVAELQKRLNSASDGECQFVIVAGEPGVGKTRLVEEIENLARARKMLVLHGRFLEQDRTFAYQGFCEVIQEFFRTRNASASGEHPDFSDLAADLIALFPVLSEIGELRAAASGEVSARGEPRRADDRTYIFELLARTITRIAGGKPLVLVFENLHSAELSLDALQYVVRRLGPTPTLIIGTYRQTEIDKRHPLTKLLDSFADDPRSLQIALGPFSGSEHRRFIESIVGSSELAAGLAERLFEATEANPFFTRELLRSLIDSGGIARSDTGEWTLSGEMAISSDALPATIQQTVEKRIERLPDDMREILSIASVIGRSFEFRELESLAEGKGELDDMIDRFVYEGLIEEERESRGDRLAFSSGIVRDVLYGALSRRKRKSLHRRYAELLQSRNAGRLDRIYPQLVHHFSEGDVPEKTVEYGLLLARRSLDSFSADEAVNVLRTVLEFLDDDDWNPPRDTEAEARMLMASALRQQGQIDAALKEAESAAKIFTTEKMESRACIAILMAAETAWQGRRVEETRRWLDQGIETARKAGEVQALMSLLSLAATVANLRGDYAKAKGYLDEIEQLRPASPASAAEDIPSGGTLHAALANPAPAREPSHIGFLEEAEVLALAFERLVSTDELGHLVPSLCESWQVAADGRSMTLKVRDGIRFHDGAPLNARAVKDSFEHATRNGKRDTAANSVIEGFEEYRSGGAEEISGIVLQSDLELIIHLKEALPIYPALLTDTSSGIARAAQDGTIVGTGPFRISSHSPSNIVMEKNADYWMPGIPRLASIEFRVFPNASAIATAVRTGEVDLARDLLQHDLDDLLRDPRFRAGLKETAKKITYFVLFNHNTPLGSNEAVRRAISGVVPVHDLVWRSLGRLAQPATSLLPPGILGHDPGRRRHAITREQAIELLRSSGAPLPITLRAAVQPLYLDRYRSLFDGLLDIWSSIGVNLEIVTSGFDEFIATYTENENIDVRIMRWAGDYDDADNFTYGLFHSGSGLLSRYFSTSETDRLVEEGRGQKSPSAREGIYRRFENVVAESGTLLPLFHEIDYRLANPFVRGMQLHSRSPFVNYAELGKSEHVSQSSSLAASGGTLQVPVPGEVLTLEPTLASTVEQNEVLPLIFDTLTRLGEGARVQPWLASEITTEQGGRRYRIRLREDIRFHDGRRLTARDVRYSLERLFSMQESSARWFYTSVKGSAALMNGTTRELEGLQILSPFELTIDLDRPFSVFLTLLSYPAASIVPEGTETLGASWNEGCVGTGPFRVVRFEPGRRLEVERNPLYWR